MIICIVIPAYNKAELLQKAVVSLLKSDYPSDDFQIIVVDDASTDHTRQVMEDLKTLSLQYQGAKAAHAKLVCVHHDVNRNAAAARNSGILTARPDVDILAFIDQDCTVSKNWLRVMADLFGGHQDVDYIGGPVLCNHTNIWQEWASFMSHQICDHEDFQTRVIGTNMAFRKEIFQDHFFDENVGYGTDETEFAFRLSIQGFKQKICPDLVVYHYHRDNVVDLVKQRWRYAQGEARFYWKYGFGIYHPINSYMLKTDLAMLGAIGCFILGLSSTPWILMGIGLSALWLRYMIKYARIRYTSFLKNKGIPTWKMAAFISINWLVDNVVLISKLKLGNPI